MSALKRLAGNTHAFSHIDWFVFASALTISLFGLVTMHSFSGDNSFFEKQLIWICVAIAGFFIASIPEYSFLKRTSIIAAFYAITMAALVAVLFFGAIVKGAQTRLSLGFLAGQPSDPAKLLLILLLAKYFARRHVEIAAFRHILISGAYAFSLFALVFFQPDLGSSIIIASIWLGMVLVAGISWKHLGALFTAAALVMVILWNFGLHDYQKQRILTFVHPLADVRGAGYNAYQSTIAVGSGEIFGKGVGYGTQSKLRFLPEYQTDFIFAAYAEEWGFVGVVIVVALFGLIIWRILAIASDASDNFGMLFCIGIAIFILAQFIVHVGMNIGLMPITGSTLPFMSYGGSHLVTEYIALGILMGMRRSARPVRNFRDNELVGAI